MTTADYSPPMITWKEPRWPAAIAGVAIGLLYLALPTTLVAGPRWLVPVLVLALTVPSLVTHYKGHRQANRVLGFAITGLLTVFLIWSLGLLVIALPAKTESPLNMLLSAATLWVSNVMIFALWYWRIDAGGPNGRDLRPGHDRGAFLFPQMTEEGQSSIETGDVCPPWSPQFVDYLFIAFNTSTAFSPTDCPVLSRWAKALTMTQASISLSVTVLLAARAVNIM